MVLGRRDALTECERADASVRICERAHEVIASRCSPGEVIGLYAAKGSEVETEPLDAALRAAGFRIAYPRVVEAARVLAFHETTIAELAPSRWGLREPRAEQSITIEEIAAFVVPGLAFDREGGRVGWGRGHYDATLAVARAGSRGSNARRGVTSIGLAFECQLVERVPRERHDATLDVIITEVAAHGVA